MNIKIDSATVKKVANLGIALSIFVLAAALYWRYGDIRKLSQIAEIGSAVPETYSYLLAALKTLSAVLAAQALTLAYIGTVAILATVKPSASGSVDSKPVPKNRLKWPYFAILLGCALLGFILFLFAVPIPGFQGLDFSAAHFNKLLLWYKRIALILMPIFAVITILFAIKMRSAEPVINNRK